LEFIKVSNGETIFTEFNLDNILASNEIFQFNVISISGVLYWEIKIYSKDILDEQMRNTNSVSLPEAFLRNEKYVLL